MAREYHPGNPRPLPRLSILQSIFDYDPATGFITSGDRAVAKSIRASLARSDPDTRIRLHGVRYRLERIAWKLQHGVDPPSSVIALDGNLRNLRSDNLLCDMPHRVQHPLYLTWIGIVYRCTSPVSVAYADYGGRGIKVCDRWLHSFEAFVNDVGERPPGTTLHRKDNNGDYEPGNCKWATHAEQHARGAKRLRRLKPNANPMRNISLQNRQSPYRLDMKLPNHTTYRKSFATLEEATSVRDLVEYEREIYSFLLLPDCFHL